MEFQQLTRRRRLSLEQKREILSDHFDKGISISVLARKNGIHPVTLYSWKRKMKDNEVTQSVDIQELFLEVKKLKSELKKSKQVIGDLMLDKQAAEEIIDYYKKKLMNDQLKLAGISTKKVQSLSQE